MTLSSCNPKLGYGVANVLSNHYPERLGLVICLNHSPVFHGVWKAIKQFIHPHTAAKVKMVRSSAKMVELFSQVFSPEMSAWLQEEITLNKQKPLPKAQAEFWCPPAPGAHDPRGCPSYVRQHIQSYQSKSDDQSDSPTKDKTTPTIVSRPHRPHPNILTQLAGRSVTTVTLSKEEELERLQAQSMAESGEGGGTSEEEEEAIKMEIPSELQIPASAVPLSTPS